MFISDEESVSDFDETSGYSARRRVSGARDRFVFGDLNVASVGCQDGLPCVPVGAGRSECRPENPNGTSKCILRWFTVIQATTLGGR